ncbi:MAG TPA: HEAT repeat domain-containing protein [Chloroflexota bacterium]
MASFEDTLKTLAAHQRLKPSQMKQLSGLASEQLRQFRSIWSEMQDAERMTLMASLRRHARDDSLADYDSIYLAAMDDPNGDVRRVAVSAVVCDDSPLLLERLLQLCESDEEETVRAAAAERLSGYAYEAEVGTFPEEAAREIERVLLGRARSEEEGTNVRALALASAGYISSDAVRAELKAGVQVPSLRLAAIRGIGRNIDPQFTEILVEQMGSDDASVRREAAEASADYEDTVEKLTGLVDDTVLEVRLAAISSLGKIGGPEAKDVLVYCYESRNPTIKKAASAALHEIETQEDLLGSAGPEWEEDEEEDGEEQDEQA